MESGVPCQPTLHGGVLVGGVVVDDDVDRDLPGVLGVNSFQELDPFLMPVPALTAWVGGRK
jgi:hypothetical protein